MNNETLTFFGKGMTIDRMHQMHGELNMLLQRVRMYTSLNIVGEIRKHFEKAFFESVAFSVHSDVHEGISITDAINQMYMATARSSMYMLPAYMRKYLNECTDIIFVETPEMKSSALQYAVDVAKYHCAEAEAKLLVYNVIAQYTTTRNKMKDDVNRETIRTELQGAVLEYLLLSTLAKDTDGVQYAMSNTFIRDDDSELQYSVKKFVGLSGNEELLRKEITTAANHLGLTGVC